jgi:hypothetical protein
MEPQLKEKVITFATSEHYQGAVELLKQCRTQISSIVAEDEFHTLLNALTLEVESSLIQRFVIAVDEIRTGKNLNEPTS